MFHNSIYDFIIPIKLSLNFHLSNITFFRITIFSLKTNICSSNGKMKCYLREKKCLSDLPKRFEKIYIYLYLILITLSYMKFWKKISFVLINYFVSTEAHYILCFLKSVIKIHIYEPYQILMYFIFSIFILLANT